jgi:cyclic-di-GMP-binding protein
MFIEVHMPSFDVVSEVDHQEVKNAIDQAQRELANRFDFKNTNSSIEQKDLILTLRTSTEDRLNALRILLEEKLVRRKISLKGIEWGKFEVASGDRVRQEVTITVGITSEKSKQILRLIKEEAPKGISGQFQTDHIRVTGKKRDDLQETMAIIKQANLGIPLQFNNYRD